MYWAPGKIYRSVFTSETRNGQQPGAIGPGLSGCVSPGSLFRRHARKSAVKRTFEHVQIRRAFHRFETPTYGFRCVSCHGSGALSGRRIILSVRLRISLAECTNPDSLSAAFPGRCPDLIRAVTQKRAGGCGDGQIIRTDPVPATVSGAETVSSAGPDHPDITRHRSGSSVRTMAEIRKAAQPT